MILFVDSVLLIGVVGGVRPPARKLTLVDVLESECQLTRCLRDSRGGPETAGMANKNLTVDAESHLSETGASDPITTLLL